MTHHLTLFEFYGAEQANMADGAGQTSMADGAEQANAADGANMADGADLSNANDANANEPRYRLVCTGVPPPKVCPCGDLTGSGRDLAWFSGV